jgi:hypothetical protein
MVNNHAKLSLQAFNPHLPDPVDNNRGGPVLPESKIYLTDGKVSRPYRLTGMRTQYFFCYRVSHFN